MAITESKKYLWRYSDLPAVIYMLTERKLTLVDPQSWDDKNDSYYLNVYKDKQQLASILALSFTRSNEAYHHWRVFSGSSSGVSVRFNRVALLKALRKEPMVAMRNVRYLTLSEMRPKKLKLGDLPFIKRAAFEHECEYRVVCESAGDTLPHLDIAIPLSCISQITLSPWIRKNIFASVRGLLNSIDG